MHGVQSRSERQILKFWLLGHFKRCCSLVWSTQGDARSTIYQQPRESGFPSFKWVWIDRDPPPPSSVPETVNKDRILSGHFGMLTQLLMWSFWPKLRVIPLHAGPWTLKGVARYTISVTLFLSKKIQGRVFRQFHIFYVQYVDRGT